MVLDKFLDVGFGYRVPYNRIYAMLPIVSPSSKSLKRDYRKNNALINACMGRRERTLILLDNDMAVCSALTTETLDNNYTEEKAIDRVGVRIGSN